MKCLVLGGAGFIGQNLCEALVGIGHQVYAVDLPESLARMQHPQLEKVQWVAGDFAQTESLLPLLNGVDLVFHLVSTTLPSTSNDSPQRDLQDNVSATLRLLDLIIAQATPPRVIFLSSGGTVYGLPQAVPIAEDHPTDPLCAYGIGKLAIEKYLALYHHLHGLDYHILRLANPYGPRQPLGRGQGVIPVFLYKALRKEPLELWGDGGVVRDYLYIGDLCRALLAIITYTGSERIFNIGSGQGHSLNDVIGIIRQILETDFECLHLPARACDVPVNILSIQRAHQELGWSPKISLYHGITLLLPWLQRVAAETAH